MLVVSGVSAEPAATLQSAPEQATAPLPANNEAEAKAFIYFKESTNRTDAINPESGACGLGQALPCSKLPCSLKDYGCQDQMVRRLHDPPIRQLVGCEDLLAR